MVTLDTLLADLEPLWATTPALFVTDERGGKAFPLAVVTRGDILRFI